MQDPFDLPPDVLRRVPLFAELQKVLAWREGPVNWDLARQMAVAVAGSEESTQRISGEDHKEATELVRVAELWLTGVTGLPALARIVTARAATMSEWAAFAVDGYRELIDPIAAKAARALTDHSTTEGVQAQMAGALQQIAPLFLGIQAGTVIGSLAREVTGAGDVAMPIADGELVLVLPAIDDVARQYGLDPKQARQWVALREMASRMVLDGFPGVRAQFFALYHNYVASLDIDLGQGLQRLQEIDVTDPQRLQEVLSEEGILSPEPSPETARAASAVNRFLVLVDALTSEAVDGAGRSAVDPHVGEAFRRRAVTGGDGHRLFHRFIGLDPPSGWRQAQSFVRAVVGSGGWLLVARMLEDPDGLPTEEELASPDTWLRRMRG